MTYKWVPSGVLRVYQLLLLSVAVIWGVDYIITPKWAIGSALSVVEAAFPLYVWGTFFMLSGIGGLMGEAWLTFCRFRDRHRLQWNNKFLIFITDHEHRGWVSYLAHAGLVALYTSLGMGYALQLVIEWHVWGLRAPVLMFSFAAAHYIFMRRRTHVGTIV